MFLLPIFCSFLLNFSHILDIQFHHACVREKNIARFLSLFP
jgi:hypothetical protein